eukprot:1571536-Amphidinium_carterae.1
MSDSTAALAALMKASSASPGINFIAAEISLRLDAWHVPQLLTRHVAGRLNGIADALSRQAAPERKSLPHELSEVKLKEVSREEGFFWLPSPGSRAHLWH